ncbi:MAG: TonB-dependent receptor [Chitinophagales bacterium]|nr:TonB-dependent receptor [Chitinophagales bacterium]HMV03157.1 TonB-dependent receptor [Chitinophagales bacterium]HNC63423.1 TonB-dependent receptor [Chitinophagales bacterium]
MNRYLFILLLHVCTVQTTFAQNIIKGSIIDSKTKEAIIGANVDCGTVSTVSDFDGNFEINLPDGQYTLKVSYVSYSNFQKEITLTNNQVENINIVLEEEAKNLLGQDLVITGSLFEKRASEEVISIEVVKPQAILNMNAIRIDEVARKVSGLIIADGQASIRAGSGWAYGVGSRVMFIVDGQPILSPDRGDIKWSILPTEAIGQLEVLKGASSVLYGSSAMNGTIHLQTVKPTKKPLTRFTMFQSFLAPPKDRVKKWWDFPVPSFGGTFLRAHKPRETFEYFVSGSAYLNNTQFQNGLEYMARINFRTKWTNPKNSKMSYGLAGSFMYNREYEVFFWQNGTDGAYKAGADNAFNNIRFTVDPFFTIYDKKNNKHEIKTRSYFNRPSFATKTFLETIDYNFNKNFTKIGLNLIVGANEQMLVINVPAFLGSATKFGNIFALYAQLDKKFKDRVTLSGGLRMETYKYEKNVGVTPPVGRLGMNIRVGKESFLRFNLGQAFRFPSFAERFVDETVGNESKTYHLVDTTYPGDGLGYVRERDSVVSNPLLKIMPNPNLKPEYGWTSEIGFQQIFKTKSNKYSGVFDAAFYWQEYRDLVDFGGVIDSSSNAKINLKAQNISRARIAGWDISFKNNMNFKNHSFDLNLGYTYAFPIELNSNIQNPNFDNSTIGGYIKNMFKSFTKRIGGIDFYQVLKYRNRHLITLDAEYSFKKKITIGLNARYYSNFEGYDIVFLGIEGIPEKVSQIDKKGKGDWVLNGQLFYTVKEKHNFGFIIKNMLNKEYWLRAGKLESPMNFTVQYRIEF